MNLVANIQEILQASPNLMAKAIAKELGVTRTEINSLLYKNPKLFEVDSTHHWNLKASRELKIEFPENAWVDGESFEDSLKMSESPLDSLHQQITFSVPAGCKIKLDAAARLMALCNQLAMCGKQVSIDFTHCFKTLTYLDRMGFFEHLSLSVTVTPKRPKTSRATLFRGNNNKVVEFGAVDPVMPDINIPVQLKDSFVAHAGEQYSQPAFTILSELFGNVQEHSKSPIPGFVALQCYKRGRQPHIQTVISDSGKGIVGTLWPTLLQRYPDLANRLKTYGDAAGAYLLKEIFLSGRISQSDGDGRGLGLKRSGDMAAKFNGKISIRQEYFEARFHFLDGKLNNFAHTLNMPRIFGTHICFDFLLDAH